MRNCKAHVLKRLCHFTDTSSHPCFSILRHNPDFPVSIFKIANVLHIKFLIPCLCMKTDPGTSLLLLFIVKSFLKDFQNFFFFHWFDQISERMDTKRILSKIFISCHINDLCLFIPNSDFSGSINPRNSFHVNVQKDHIIKNIRFQECLSAFKIRDAKNRFQLFEICLHLFSHCRLIITYRNFFHFLFIPLPIIFLA